jgi:uncharacterized protein (DUF2147 family)
MRYATKIAAAALASLLVAAPVFAVAADPTGTWQADDGKSRYKITFCGDRAELCGKLIWLRDADDKNMAYLNQQVVNGEPVSANQWTGTVIHEGGTYTGTMTVIGEDSLKVKACSGIFCQSLTLARV